jgi:hypothetical protein
MKTSANRRPSANETDTRTVEEVRRLRAEVAALKQKLAEIHSPSDVELDRRNDQPWLRIAATVGVTFALGKLIQVLKLPTAVAVAIPMITSEVNRRWL